MEQHIAADVVLCYLVVVLIGIVFLLILYISHQQSTIKKVSGKVFSLQKYLDEGTIPIYCQLNGEFYDYAALFYVHIKSGALLPDKDGTINHIESLPVRVFPLPCPRWRKVEGETFDGHRQVVFEFDGAERTIYNIPPEEFS
jgi:hypothetical protein